MVERIQYGTICITITDEFIYPITNTQTRKLLFTELLKLLGNAVWHKISANDLTVTCMYKPNQRNLRSNNFDFFSNILYQKYLNIDGR